MKQKVNGKMLAVIGSLIFLLGVVAFTVALGLSGWDITRISNQPRFEEVTETIESSYDSVILKDNDVPITVGVSPDEKIHLTYFINKYTSYDFIDEGDTLEIEKRKNAPWISFFFNIDFQFPTFTLLLPKEYTGGLELYTGNASITLENLTVGDTILQTGNGIITLENLTTGNLKAATSNSSVELRSVSAGNATLSTSNGKMVLEEVTAEEVKATTSNNQAQLSKVDCADLEVTTSNGKISCDTVKSAAGIQLRTDNNSISLEEVDAGEMLTLRASNGSISGQVVGSQQDFSIRSSTSNGSNNLPPESQGGGKELVVENTNGSIEIKFTD